MAKQKNATAQANDARDSSLITVRLDQLRAAFLAVGLEPPATFLADGKPHRFHVAGDKAGSRNGYYVLAQDSGSAAFGCFKRGINKGWSATPPPDDGRVWMEVPEPGAKGDAAAIKTREHFPFLSSGGTCDKSCMLAVMPGVSTRAALEHASYVLASVSSIHDAISNGAFSDGRLHDVTTGLDYLVQLACGLVEASVNAMAVEGGAA